MWARNRLLRVERVSQETTAATGITATCGHVVWSGWWQQKSGSADRGLTGTAASPRLGTRLTADNNTTRGKWSPPCARPCNWNFTMTNLMIQDTCGTHSYCCILHIQTFLVTKCCQKWVCMRHGLLICKCDSMNEYSIIFNKLMSVFGRFCKIAKSDH